MNRRQFVLAVSDALALFAAAGPAHAECGGLSITEIVCAAFGQSEVFWMGVGSCSLV
jgi:hypothetical protein